MQMERKWETILSRKTRIKNKITIDEIINEDN